jgi:predicted HD superfamily hydrolase involved in NAD metabolism
VRTIARKLAEIHEVDPDLAELAAAAHDIARHLTSRQLLETAQYWGINVSPIERNAPILLHGHLGAVWLKQDGEITDPDVLDAIRWHTSAHPALSPVGRILFLADKLDPKKISAYPFQETVSQVALRDLNDGILAFLEGLMKIQIDKGQLIHPMTSKMRNALIMAKSC